LSWLLSKIKSIFSDDKVKHEFNNELERVLYEADLGSDVVKKVLSSVSKTKNAEDVKQLVENELMTELLSYKKGFILDDVLTVILVVGVNGVGKTTSTAKLANYIKNKYNKKVMLSGADTFRAAGVDQLEFWANKLGISFFSKGHGADPSAVAYESVLKAKSDAVDVLIIDTGGRLHTQDGLMSEVSKMQRAIKKSLGTDPKHVLMILDSTQGQNIKNQLELFNEALNISGLIITKFDATAKGGALFGALRLIRKPIFFVCNGEQLENISEFEPSSFVRKIL